MMPFQVFSFKECNFVQKTSKLHKTLKTAKLWGVNRDQGNVIFKNIVLYSLNYFI